ncbi:KGGVGR-motif variant AAA ATPase [Pedobacter sp. N23S346]|uniref:KGGVGR-motif variant AAA ATPase n=1 Tax=Pedobacter sp. N23S346 TaxID=3402750 RepID=UPI003AD04A6A
MKTVTFYSYKGGVGRSLALSKIAMRLSEMNKKVCVLDFDLDAPGLRFKFRDYNLSSEVEKGIVDYIYEFSDTGRHDHPISEYAVKLVPINESFSEIDFISAGDIDGSDYWKKLSMIRWADMFYGDHPRGVSFFLDLKAKIERELQPDYFLIDSRTGITDISGITLRLLADQVVVLAVNNQENIFGSKKIIRNLLSDGYPGEPLKINFVLTRVPFSSTEIELENRAIEILKEDFERELGVEDFQISVIHSDLELKMNDSYVPHKLAIVTQNASSKDYFKLFDLITENSLSMTDTSIRIREAENEFAKYMAADNRDLQFKHIDRAITLNPSNYIFYSHRGILHYQNRDVQKAIADYQRAIKLNAKDPVLKFNLAHFYESIGELETSLAYLDQSYDFGEKSFLAKSRIMSRLGRLEESIESLNIVLEINPLNAVALNRRAHALRVLGNYQQAFVDISKAIEADPKQAIFFATLAEIYAAQGKHDEFYLNFSIALSKGLTASAIATAKDIYLKYSGEKKFVELLTKYNIFLDDL